MAAYPCLVQSDDILLEEDGLGRGLWAGSGRDAARGHDLSEARVGRVLAVGVGLADDDVAGLERGGVRGGRD